MSVGRPPMPRFEFEASLLVHGTVYAETERQAEARWNRAIRNVMKGVPTEAALTGRSHVPGIELLRSVGFRTGRRRGRRV